MQYPIIGRRLGAVGALTLAAALLAACAEAPPPPAAYAPPAGYSGSSTPPAASLTGGAGYGSSEPAAPRRFVVNAKTPLRQGPRNGFPIIAVLPAGTPVATDGYVGGDWWQVQTRFGTGWVYSRDLSAS
jgi:hypothetical protein